MIRRKKNFLTFCFLIFVILLFSLGFYYASTHNAQRDAIQAIRDAGGRFGYDFEEDKDGYFTLGTANSCTPLWLRKLAGPDWLPLFHDVAYIHLEGNRATDKTLAAISKLPKVKLLSLFDNSTVTPEGYASIGRMKSLTWLSLQHSHLDDAGLAQLAGLQQLKKLELNNTEISDQSIPLLKAFRHLDQLWVSETKITKAVGQSLEKTFPKANLDY